jgi:hypothetical protein
MPWPDATELQNYLTAAGLMATPATAMQGMLDLEDAIAAAIEQWDDATGYDPYLSTGVEEIRAFRSPAPGNILELRSGLLMLTELRVDVTATVGSGTVYTNGTHFRLLPRDASQKVKPYTQVEFLWSPGSPGWGEIAIEGLWGYTTDGYLHSTSRRGVLAMAALELLPQINQAVGQGLLRWTEGDVTKQYGAAKDIIGVWEAVIARALAPYRQLRVAG